MRRGLPRQRHSHLNGGAQLAAPAKRQAADLCASAPRPGSRHESILKTRYFRNRFRVRLQQPVKALLPASRSSWRVLIALVCAGSLRFAAPAEAAGAADVSGSWSVSTLYPVATIRYTSNTSATWQQQLDLNSYGPISGTVVQAANGSLSMAEDGTFKGQVNGTSVTFSKYESWSTSTPQASYTVGVSYSGTINGNTLSGSATISYQEDGWDGRRFYWHGSGFTTGSFSGAIAKPPKPGIVESPASQTAESGSTVEFRVVASGALPLTCLWYFNSTQLISNSTECALQMSSVQFSQAGSYTAVVTNGFGAVTSAPAMLQVIAPVARRPLPGLRFTGETGRELNIEYVDSLAAEPNWQPLDCINLATNPVGYVDPTLALSSRFYRVWQAGPVGQAPSLDMLMFPAVSLTGNPGDSFRVDYINQFGPIDAWVPLATVTLTNASQRYVDLSAPGSPPRLYRVVGYR